MAVSFIGGGNRSTRRKPPTCRKTLTKWFAVSSTDMQRILTGSCQPSQKNWSCSRFLLRVDVVQYFVIPSFALFLIIHLLYNLLILTIFFVFPCSYFVYRTLCLQNHTSSLFTIMSYWTSPLSNNFITLSFPSSSIQMVYIIKSHMGDN